MGMLSDFRKLFFGAKSVSKTAKGIVEDKAEDIIDSGRTKLNDATDLLSDKFEDLRENSWDTTVELGNKVKEKSSNLLEDISASDTLDKIKESGESLLGKSKEALTNAGEKLGDLKDSAVDKSDNAWEKIISTSDDVSGKVWDKGGELAEKAKVAGAKIEKKLDQTLADFKKKEAEYEAKEREMDADGDGFADKPIDFGSSALDGKDDFFDKAKKFAEGESINDPNKIKVGNIEITKSDIKKEIDDTLILPGFDDNDGDGDELVDDAVIIDEEPNPDV